MILTQMIGLVAGIFQPLDHAAQIGDFKTDMGKAGGMSLKLTLNPAFRARNFELVERDVVGVVAHMGPAPRHARPFAAAFAADAPVGECSEQELRRAIHIRDDEIHVFEPLCGGFFGGFSLLGHCCLLFMKE
jgi:hypothetical protein